MIKYIAIALGITGIVSGGLVIQSQSRTTPERPAPRPGPATIYAAGRIEGATEEIRLRPQLDGRIVELPIEEGQWVEKGELLLQVDSEQYQHEVALAEARLAQHEAVLERLINGPRPEERQEARALYRASEAELERAKLTWQRVQKLRQGRAVSQEEADNQRTLVDALEAKRDAAEAHYQLVQSPAREDEIAQENAKIAAARASLELAQVQLKRTRLLAPADGKILQINVRLGELTSADSAEAPILFADTSRYRVRAFVEELDARRVEVGMPTEVTADGQPDQTWPGHVTRLTPRMKQKELFTNDPAEHFDVRTREIWIDLDTTDELLIGLRVDVSIDPRDVPPLDPTDAS